MFLSYVVKYMPKIAHFQFYVCKLWKWKAGKSDNFDPRKPVKVREFYSAKSVDTLYLIFGASNELQFCCCCFFCSNFYQNDPLWLISDYLSLGRNLYHNLVRAVR